MPAKTTARQAAPEVPEIAEVRQNIDSSSPYVGAVAVRRNADTWGVMHPLNGGHWATNDEVEQWHPMSPS